MTFFTLWAKNCFLGPEHDLHQISCSGEKIAPGPPKTSPERYVYKGFCEGGAFGAPKPKKSIIPPKNALLGAWTPKEALPFIKPIVFPRKYQWFWHVENHDILVNFSKFVKICIFRNFFENRLARFPQKWIFRTRAARRRECCLNQWNTIHFGGSWAPRALFLRKSASS